MAGASVRPSAAICLKPWASRRVSGSREATLRGPSLPIPRGPCDGLPRRLPGADHPVLSASVCGQAAAIEEICAESLRMGQEFQRERVFVSMVLLAG